MANNITYQDKEALNQNPNIADINKVNDSDMNEIKNVVNGTILESLFGVSTNTWISQGAYSVGSIVIYNYKLYKNITGTNTQTTPENDTTNWQETNLLDSNLINKNLLPINNANSGATDETYSCNFINSIVPNGAKVVSKSGITTAIITSLTGYGRVWLFSALCLTIISFDGTNQTPTITDVWGTHNFTATINNNTIALASLDSWDHYIFIGTNFIESIQ